MLQRSIQLQFKTVTGLLQSADVLLADDSQCAYRIESRSARHLALVGQRVQIKGLVDDSGQPKIHLISAGGLT